MLSGKSITLLWLFFGQINALKECDPDVDVDWGYQQSNGPCKWCTDLGFKRCCETVPYQSPINIITHSAKPYPHGIVFKNYDREPHKMKLQNNGYYAELTIEVDDQNTLRNMPYISGEKLGGNNYIFEQLHFHWGCTSAQGAEHQLDGNEHIPMEMHIVHFNRDRYGNFTTAACQEDFSVAVIAVFFKISPGDNNKFSRITNALNNIQKADSTPAHVAPFKLQDLLPGDKTNTYFYNGSLTTPPCYGSVRWILFDTPVDISEEQMKKFRSLYTADGSPLVNNFRPIQNSNNRNIYKYHKEITEATADYSFGKPPRYYSSYEPYGYQESNGPDMWCCINETCCKNESNQSPIDIPTDNTEPTPEGIEFINYDAVPKKMELRNSGTTVILDIYDEQEKMPFISGGKLGSKIYQYQELHFHWGSDSSKGSEHYLNGIQYPMEMHIVHNNIKDPSEKAVIGVFFKISDRDNEDYANIIKKLDSVKYRNDNTCVTPFKLEQLLPKHNSYTYFYTGSLTTPPCSVDVSWIVLKEPVDISEAQMEKFRSLYATELGDREKVKLVNNFRPLQKLGNRIIYQKKGRLILQHFCM